MRGHQRLLVGGLAGTGVAVAHTLAYFLVTPDAHALDHLLRTTGHKYFSVCAAVSVGLLVAGFLGGIASRLRRREAPRLRYVAAALALVGLQVGGYLVLEAGERLVMGGSPIAAVSEPAVVIGTVLQIIAGLIGAAILVLFSAAVEAIGRRLRAEETRTARTGLRLRPDLGSGPRLAVASGGGSLRGPPPAIC